MPSNDKIRTSDRYRTSLRPMRLHDPNGSVSWTVLRNVMPAVSACRLLPPMARFYNTAGFALAIPGAP